MILCCDSTSRADGFFPIMVVPHAKVGDLFVFQQFEFEADFSIQIVSQVMPPVIDDQCLSLRKIEVSGKSLVVNFQ